MFSASSLHAGYAVLSSIWTVIFRFIKILLLCVFLLCIALYEFRLAIFFFFVLLSFLFCFLLFCVLRCFELHLASYFSSLVAFRYILFLENTGSPFFMFVELSYVLSKLCLSYSSKLRWSVFLLPRLLFPCLSSFFFFSLSRFLCPLGHVWQVSLWVFFSSVMCGEFSKLCLSSFSCCWVAFRFARIYIYFFSFISFVFWPLYCFIISPWSFVLISVCCWYYKIAGIS